MAACLMLLFACGEAGVESDISKSIEIDPISVQMTVPQAAVGVLVQSTPPITVNSGTIDIGTEDFGSYLEDAELFTINTLSYSIENFPAGSSADLDITVNVIIGGQTQQLLNVLIEDAQNNASNVLLYDKDNPGNANAAAVTALAQAIKDGQSFEVEMVIVGRDVTLQSSSIDFDIILGFDVTARIQLD